MKKNSIPYSEPSDIRLALSSDFSAFTVINGRFFGTKKNGKDFVQLHEVPGTLKPSVASDGLKPALYTINITFRVSYKDVDNQQELDKWTGKQVLAQYVTSGGKTVIAGTKAHPLSFSYSEPEGFDGYECTLTGTQTSPECFV